MSTPPSVHVIACGVLALDLRALAARLGAPLSMQFLPGGLHERPHELRLRLQEAIDHASTAKTAERVALAYGVCGLGLVGLHARDLPLAIPRVHDCIALFLGSDAAYKEQFARFPGTYYVSAGWVEERTEPISQSARKETRRLCLGPSLDELVARYGRENSEFIRHFLNSWQRNYQRAAFIDTGVPGRRVCADIARGMAADFGWKYEELRGTGELLTKLLSQTETSPDILIVPPHHITAYDPLEKGLKAVPPNTAATGPEELHHTVVLDGSVPPAEADDEARVDLGLGIDAGGTYTDAVLYEFRTGRVLEKAKALTTKWDFSIGIEEALGGLSPALLERVNLSSVSTTLATNAIVEGRGQKVGLLLMPPYGRYDAAAFRHAPLMAIRGQLEIDGTEIEPVDADQVRAAVRDLIGRERVGAFAVAGYASHVNPAHELIVRDAIRRESDLHVTCGHELSEAPNYRVRAETAALNARIIPCLRSLLESVDAALRRHGVGGARMVVRSDGSLMNLRTALDRPIETILSGPAASVAGARHLAGSRDALVVDMGGTTTDTATIRRGIVRTCADGATVGGWKTHVRALDIRTSGLGGDSRIALERGRWRIGPQRVAPACWLASRHPSAAQAFDWLERHADDFRVSSRETDLLMLSGKQAPDELTDVEKRIVDALGDRPLSLSELVSRMGSLSWQFLPLSRLEEGFVILRCGFTPTDLLHCTGQFQEWDGAASGRLARLFSRLSRVPEDRLSDVLLREVVRLLALEVLKKEMADELGVDQIEDSPAASALIAAALDGEGRELGVSLTVRPPVIGIGAPTYYFLPRAMALLNGKAVIPEHADVANAVGAVTSSVSVHKQARITTNETGRYIVAGLPDAPAFRTFAEAHEFTVRALQEQVLRMAREAGTIETRVEVQIDDQIATLADGGDIFVGRTIEARVSGRPDLAVADVSRSA